MMIETGALLSALVVGILLASAVAWWVAWLYRRRMLKLMRGSAPPNEGRAVPQQAPALVPQQPTVHIDLAANRRARWKLLFALAALCGLIGLTQAWLALHFVYQLPEFSLNRLLMVGAVYAWPMVLVWGLALRWPWLRTAGAIAIYVALAAALVMVGSDEVQSLLGVMTWLAGVVAIPLLVTLFLSASGRIRAVAPYLLPPFLILAAGSMLGLEVLAAAAQGTTMPNWLTPLVGNLGAYGTVALLALAPWLLFAWPVYALGRRLAAAYRAKRFSDLSYLFGAYWFVVLGTSVLPALEGVGLAGLTQLLPWLWIPLGWRLLRPWLTPSGEPPTLLVLRVFKRDLQVEALFDRVVERWRLTGNTVLIAGTDLISRTLDPDDLFAFLNRRLPGRFIASQEEIPGRLAEFDLAPDPDGRYRVNECYCFDTTWQASLHALVQTSHLVLMDLRGFRPENHGCRFELRELAAASHLQRVVLLYDRDTAQDVVKAEIATSPTGRFVWLETDRLDSSKTGQVVRALFGNTGDRS